jgi:single-stranded DNA-binding protein
MDPIWHSIFAFSENAKKYAAFYQKGQRVKVTGSLRYRETHVEGLEYPIAQAAIHARKIEPAPLPTKKGAKDAAMVTEVSGKGVEFAGSDLSTDDEIPF